MAHQQQPGIAGVAPALVNGAFVRVLQDHNDASRAGVDGQVVGAGFGGFVTLTFGHDRYNRPQAVECVGPEAWLLEELDLASIET